VSPLPPRLLVLTRHTPLPGEDGAGSYLFGLLSYLRKQGFSIRVIWFQPHDHWTQRGWCVVPAHLAETLDLHLPGQIALGRWRFFPKVYLLPWKARLLDRIKRVLVWLGVFSRIQQWSGRPTTQTDPIQKAPEIWMAPPNNEEQRVAQACAREFRPDVVLANFCWMNELFDLWPRQPRGPLRISLTVDVAHQRAAFLAKATGLKGYAGFDEAEEKRLLEISDLPVAISEADAEVFRRLCPDREVVVVPKAIEGRAAAGPQVPGRCLFVGSHNQPNCEGLTWFLEKAWPQVKAACPDAELHVCGNINEVVTGNYPGVSFLGRVEDLEMQYGEAEVVVVPLLHGSGVKIKLVEACAHGKACVTTPVGLQGLPFLAEHVLTAEDAAGLADAMIRLLKSASLRQQFERGSLAAARRELSEKQCYEPLLRIMTSRLGATTHTLGRANVSVDHSGRRAGDGSVPRVSVVMPVYNAGRYLAPAVESVLAQTFRDFEFIIVDDGSTDSSLEVLRAYEKQDARIRFISRPNTGLVGALNDGIAAARGEFIARMDADDVSLPARLERQVEILQSDAECLAVGSDVLFIDPEGAPLIRRNPPLQHAGIVAELLEGNGGALIHPSVVFRRDALVACGGYREEAIHLEDFDLYLRLMSHGRLANLPEALLLYRQHPASINHTQGTREARRAAMVNPLRSERCLAPLPMAAVEPSLGGEADWRRHWAFDAARGGHWRSARKNALRAVAAAPWKRQNWACLRYVLAGEKALALDPALA
jgi:GT2 family glycosyltransferase/glycosyltransferase involved in cell wall biosynthesis